jgi:hypothetical protein
MAGRRERTRKQLTEANMTAEEIAIACARIEKHIAVLCGGQDTERKRDIDMVIRYLAMLFYDTDDEEDADDYVWSPKSCAVFGTQGCGKTEFFKHILEKVFDES